MWYGMFRLEIVNRNCTINILNAAFISSANIRWCLSSYCYAIIEAKYYVFCIFSSKTEERKHKCTEPVQFRCVIFSWVKICLFAEAVKWKKKTGLIFLDGYVLQMLNIAVLWSASSTLSLITWCGSMVQANVPF